MKSGEKKITVKKVPRIEKERAEFKSLLIKNPNYFGNLPAIKMPQVSKMSLNTKYEELKCVGFYPEEGLLEAIIDVKLPYGYKGSLCSPGSYEYVAFWVYEMDSIEKKWIWRYLGTSRVNVHDIPDGEYACVDKAKPLSYAVTLRIDPKKRLCTSPNLVKVRAILSWDKEPPAEDPDFPPVWGNVIDKWIQIKPLLLVVKDILGVADLKKLGIVPAMLNLDLPVSEPKPLAVEELKELYEGKDVPEHRFNLVHLHQIAQKVKQDPTLMAHYKMDPKLSKVVEQISVILAEKPNTKYEQLSCVGLNYDRDTLVATLNVKLSYGYDGGLCTAGSYEYVAFWIYEWDPIENVCFWRYLGTSRVKVHDIKNAEGLQYAVYLKHDFSSYKDLCTKPKILRVRAILSWKTPPPTGYGGEKHAPVWGNSVDAVIQLKPTGVPVEPGQNVPFITDVGGMAIESISGNTLFGSTSVMGDGYANGPSVLNGFTAEDSPFGGSIAICGAISSPPSTGSKLKYKVQYRKWKSNEQNWTDWTDIVDPFWIWVRNKITHIGVQQLQEAVGGYFEYQVDENHYVDFDMLANWFTPVSGGDGLYEIQALLQDINAPPSNTVKIVVDNTYPEPDLTIDFTSKADFIDDPTVSTADKKPCGKVVGDKYIIGRFQAKDKLVDGREHYWTFGFAVLPDKIKVDSQWKITPQNFKYIPDSAVKSYPAVSTEGITMPSPPSASSPHYPTPLANGIWQLNTAGMLPCGYVVVITVWDRTIMNSGSRGRWKSASVGFCLEG